MKSQFYKWEFNRPFDTLTTTYSGIYTTPEESYKILEDGPWQPLYDYEDYVGIAHQILAEELGYTDLRVST